VRVCHPFHPLAGQELRRVGERTNMAGRRLLGLDAADAVWSIPVEWTDVAPRDPEYEISAGRAYFLFDDLLGLLALIPAVRR